jgi:hypothetical protein
MEFKATLQQLKELESSGIIRFRSFGGVTSTAEMVAHSPYIYQAISSAGDVFNIWRQATRQDRNIFRLTTKEF